MIVIHAVARYQINHDNPMSGMSIRLHHDHIYHYHNSEFIIPVIVWYSMIYRCNIGANAVNLLLRPI
jgi:hypothetical protein